MNNLIKQIEELDLRCDSSTLLPVILQVEQLLKERDKAIRERDEARRLTCRLLTPNGSLELAKVEALSLGWDCYKNQETQ